MTESEKYDWLDLMVDEFGRISHCPGATEEIIGLCERAIVSTKQRFPVIAQRDEANNEAARWKAKYQELKGSLSRLIEKD